MPTSSPILNHPHEASRIHCATNLAGELDYERIQPDRRPFTPEFQSVPVRIGAQNALLGHDGQPFSMKPDRQIAMRGISQFGEEATKALRV